MPTPALLLAVLAFAPPAQTTAATEAPAVYVAVPESLSGVVVVGARADRQKAGATIAAKLAESGAARIVRVPEAAHVRVDVFALDVEANRGYVARTRVTAGGTAFAVDGRCGMGCVTQDKAAAWDSAAANAAQRIQQWLAENRERLVGGGGGAGAAIAGIALSLAPEDVASAIAASATSLEQVLVPYRLKAPLPANKPPLTVTVLTPWARMAEWAAGLRKTGADPSQTRAPRAVLEASVTVTAEPAAANETVRHVVALRGGRTDHDARIAPLRVGEETGAAGRSKFVAVFGPEVLEAGTELRFVMADGRQASVQVAEDWVRKLR